jgi:hypothetical protein
MSGDHSIYILDTNVFLEAARNYYAFDIVPRFWKSLIEQAEGGQIKSIDRVKAEIDRYGDEDNLKVWANESFNNWFAKTDESAVLNVYGSIIQWAKDEKQYRPAAKAEFSSAENADAWVVAYAKANDYVVVTHEGSHPDAKTWIPIPNICRAFDIPCISIYKMLRELHVKLC